MKVKRGVNARTRTNQGESTVPQVNNRQSKSAKIRQIRPVAPKQSVHITRRKQVDEASHEDGNHGYEA